MNVKKQMGQLSRRKLLKFSAGAVGTGATGKKGDRLENSTKANVL